MCHYDTFWERQWQVVLQKVSILRTFVGRRYNNLVDHCKNWHDESCACKIDFYSQPKKLSMINENKRRPGLINNMAQTIVVRGTPDAGSSCLQLVYHTLSKTVNSHIAMDENCFVPMGTRKCGSLFSETEWSPLYSLIYLLDHLQVKRTLDHRSYF